MTYKDIDQKALKNTQHFKRCEADLLNIIIELDEKKVFRKMGYASLFQYVVKRLGLSEAMAYNFINVARKTKEVPELKRTIERGELTVCKAKKITSIINNSNQKHWLDLARSESQRKIEREVALAQPHKSISDRSTYVSSSLEVVEKVQIKSSSPKLKLELGVSEKLMLKLRRAQNLTSQKHRKSVSLETTLEAMVSEFLKKNDPLERAKRQYLKGKLKPVFDSEQQSIKSDEANPRNSTSQKVITLSKPRKARVARPVRFQSISKKSSQALQEEYSNVKSKNTYDKNSQIKSKIHNGINSKIHSNINPMDQMKRRSLPASLKHSVYLRDQGQCTARDKSDQKCQSQRFLEIHHILPRSQGGEDNLENLILLCSGHQKAVHD